MRVLVALVRKFLTGLSTGLLKLSGKTGLSP